jgi:hypothetical protein
MWQPLRNVAPIAISLIALTVTTLSLFFSQIQAARIRVYPSEFAYVGQKKYNLEFHITLTFTNDGAAFGVVRKVALLIRPPGKSDGYLLQAAYFDKLEDGVFKNDSAVGPIPVDGHCTVSRKILFISARDRPNDRPLSVRGEYRATVLVWASKDSRPTTTPSFRFVLSDPDIEGLTAQRLGKRTKTIELHLQQFQRWSAGAINEQDIRDLGLTK